MDIQPRIRLTPDSLNEKIQKLEIDYNTPKDMLIGTFISRTLSLNLAGIDGTIPAEIKVEIAMDDEQFEAQPTFIITDAQINDNSGEILLKGKDYSIKLDKHYNLNLNYPLTLGELAQAIANEIEVPIKDLNFTNSDFVMERAKIDEKFTYREIIGMIASAIGGIAFINENDQIEFKVITDTELEVENYFENIISEENIGPINSVVLAREPISDNIQLKDDQSIEDYGKTEIKIVNNYLIDDNREGAIQGIYDNLEGKEFACAMIETYMAYKIKPFDIVEVNNRRILVNSLNFKFPEILNGHIGIEQLTKTEIETKTAKGLEKAIVDAEAKTDKVDGKVDILASRTSELEQQSSQLQVAINSITSSVKLLGGNNKQKNSIGAYGTEDYEQSEEGHIIAYEDETLKTVTDNGFGRIIYLTDGKWFKFKSDSLVIGETYTLSFKYSNDEDNHCVIDFINNNTTNLVDTLEEKTLETVEYTFTANTEFVELYVSTGEVGRVGITDYYLQTGDVATKWQSSSGEALSTTLAIYYDGIEVKSANSEIITNISNLGFTVKNTNGKILITFNKDRCIMNDAEINGTFYQGTWLRYTQNINSYNHLLEVEI